MISYHNGGHQRLDRARGYVTKARPGPPSAISSMSRPVRKHMLPRTEKIANPAIIEATKLRQQSRVDH